MRQTGSARDGAHLWGTVGCFRGRATARGGLTPPAGAGGGARLWAASAARIAGAHVSRGCGTPAQAFAHTRKRHKNSNFAKVSL